MWVCVKNVRRLCVCGCDVRIRTKQEINLTQFPWLFFYLLVIKYCPEMLPWDEQLRKWKHISMNAQPSDSGRAAPEPLQAHPFTMTVIITWTHWSSSLFQRGCACSKVLRKSIFTFLIGSVSSLRYCMNFTPCLSPDKAQLTYYWAEVTNWLPSAET